MRLARGRRRRIGVPSRPSWGRTAAELTGPLFAGSDAGTAFRGGFGWSGNGRARTVSVTVRHVRGGGELEVETTDDPDRGSGEHDDWRLASDWAFRALRPERLAFPLTLTAQRWQQDVLVDGGAVPFVFVGGSDTWVGRGSVGGRRVSVAGSDWPARGLTLRAVTPREVSGDVPAASPR